VQNQILCHTRGRRKEKKDLRDEEILALEGPRPLGPLVIVTSLIGSTDKEIDHIGSVVRVSRLEDQVPVTPLCEVLDEVIKRVSSRKGL